MAANLKKIFPGIWQRNEILKEIRSNPLLLNTFEQWTKKQQEEFLDFCTGVRGVRVLSDSFFKEILNPESTPERLEDFLSLVLQQDVKILSVLSNDNSRLADESSLVIMDIVVELKDVGLANIEVQRIGYQFPGARAACYSADLLLRQYKRVKGKKKKKKKFSYRDVKKVYTIILFEKSTGTFHRYPEVYIHHFRQGSDTGLKMDLLQEYTMIPLDIFKAILHNKGISNRLEAWLTFLSVDEPEYIERLCAQYPEFCEMYEEVYAICQNVERVMDMFSKELQELDRNTVQLMMDEMQEEADKLKEELEANKKESEAIKKEIEVSKKKAEANKKEAEASKKEAEASKKEAEASKKEAEASKKEAEANKKEAAVHKKAADTYMRELEMSRKEAAAKDEEIERLRKMLAEKIPR